MKFFLLLILLSALLASAAFVYDLPPGPLVWFAVCGTICFIAMNILSRRTWLKAVGFNLAFIFFVLAALEGYAQWDLKKVHRQTPQSLDGTKFSQQDEILGYAPIPNQKKRFKKTHGDDVIFEATYTIGADGLRLSPPLLPGWSCPSMLFFGGSYTFGEGIDDQETMPYQTGLLTQCPVYNFAFGGYGPHQMLAAIDSGRVGRIVAYRPALAVYLVISDHLKRITGRVSWDRHGPKYEIGADGLLEYAGHFDDSEVFADLIQLRLKQSGINKRFILPRRRENKEDIRLFIAIVEAARAKLQLQYPDIAFHMIIWDLTTDNPSKITLYNWWYQELRRRGFQLHLASQILPDYAENRQIYEIRGDGHPNARAHRLLAEYIAHAIWPPTVSKTSGQ